MADLLFFLHPASFLFSALSLHDALPIYRLSSTAGAGPPSPSRNRTSWRSAGPAIGIAATFSRSEEHTSELQSLRHLVCRLLLEKKKEIASVLRTRAGLGMATTDNINRTR